MKELRITFYEISRLLRIRRTWIFVFIFTFTPVLLCTDYFGLGNSYSGSMSGVFMLQPAKVAVFAGVLAAAVLTLLELHRLRKFRMNIIIETITSPAKNCLRLTGAILAVTFCSVLLSMCFVLPYTAVSMGNIFQLRPFLACWGLLYFGGILTAVLLAAGLYMITQSFDISLILLCILVMMSFFLPSLGPGTNYLLYWVQTNIDTFSDATESLLVIDRMAYTRLVSLLAAAGIFTLGLTCVRKYGKNLIQSFFQGSKRIVTPVLALFLLFGGCYLFVHEPYIDKGPILKSTRSVDTDTGIVVYNTDGSSFNVDNSVNRQVSFSTGKATVAVDTNTRLLSGQVEYLFSNPTERKQDVPFQVTPGLDFKEVYENDKKIAFTKNPADNYNASVYHLQLTGDKEGVLRIVYGGSPKGGNDCQRSFWGITDEFVLIPGIYPEPAGALPPVDCTLHLPERLTPFMEGIDFQAAPSEKTGTKVYRYESGRAVWLFAGDYTVEHHTAGGQEIQFVYLKDRAQAMKENGAAQIVVDAVNFFSDTFGPLNFNGQPFVILEMDGSFVNGGWGLGNMSVFGEESFVGGAYKGAEGADHMEGGVGIGTAVHEIAHQWWGWGPGSVYITEDGGSPWSSEGLTVYSTYLYMKHRFGEEYAKKEFVDQWENSTKKMQNAFYLTHLEYAEKLSDEDAANIYTPFSSTTKYEMMPHLLVKAAELKGGEALFVAELAKLSQQYRFSQVNYETFLSFMGLTKEDLIIDGD